jgi:hypothetical protein
MLIEIKTTTGYVHLAPYSTTRVVAYTNDWDTPAGTHAVRLFQDGRRKKDSFELYRGTDADAARRVAAETMELINSELRREERAWHEPVEAANVD